MNENAIGTEVTEIEFGAEVVTESAIEEDGKTLKLKAPIKINGDAYAELQYDFAALTAKDLHEVSKYLKQCGIAVTVASLDFDYQLCIFHKAVRAKMSKVALSDILRLRGADSMAATGLARNFLLDTDPGQRELGALMESDE